MALDIKKHRIVMINLLKDIVTSPYGKILWFKWGTLLYFLYNLDRFSTDLDFDLLSKIDEEKMLNDLSQICAKYGKIKDIYNKENTLFLLIDYQQHEMNIKIEISKKTKKSDTYSYKSILWYQALCMDPDCLFANKLIALTQRNRIVSRDLYDVHFFLKNGFSIKHEVIQEKTGKSVLKYFKEVLAFIPKNFNKENLLAGLGELVNEKQKVFIKDKLIDETCEYLKLMIK